MLCIGTVISHDIRIAHLFGKTPSARNAMKNWLTWVFKRTHTIRATTSRTATSSRRRPTRLGLEMLETRSVPTVTATYSQGLLTITADGADNIIVTSQGGDVKVNGN